MVYGATFATFKVNPSLFRRSLFLNGSGESYKERVLAVGPEGKVNARLVREGILGEGQVRLFLPMKYKGANIASLEHIATAYVDFGTEYGPNSKMLISKENILVSPSPCSFEESTLGELVKRVAPDGMLVVKTNKRPSSDYGLDGLHNLQFFSFANPEKSRIYPACSEQGMVGFRRSMKRLWRLEEIV